MNRKSLPFILAGIGLGVAAYLGFRKLAQSSRFSELHLTSADLKSPDNSPEDLVLKHLVDLNAAHVDQLKQLGLDVESAERVIENRPYRNKMELVSRMIIPEVLYDVIKSKIAIATASEAIKIAAS
jgi:DNA uptake protein ComE-like DNA-binding protein